MSSDRPAFRGPSLAAIPFPDAEWLPFRGLALTAHAERAIEELWAVIGRQPEATAAASRDPDFQALHGRPDWEPLVGVDR